MKIRDFAVAIEKEHAPIHAIFTGYKNEKMAIKRIAKMYGMSINVGEIDEKMLDELYQRIEDDATLVDHPSDHALDALAHVAPARPEQQETAPDEGYTNYGSW